MANPQIVPAKPVSNDVFSFSNEVVLTDVSGTVRYLNNQVWQDSQTLMPSNGWDVNTGNGNDMIDATATTTHNFLNGGNGQDVILGGSGVDEINGGNGDDIINGGLGDDILTGGNGSDLFILAPEYYDIFGIGNVITDFVTGEDKVDVGLEGTAGNYIEIDASGFADMSAVLWDSYNYFSYPGVIAHVLYYNVNGEGNGILVSDPDLLGGYEGAVTLIGINTAESFDYTDIVATV